MSVFPGVRLRWHYANIVTARGAPFASRLSSGASRGLPNVKPFEGVLRPATEARRFLPPQPSQLPPPAGPTSQGEWVRIVSRAVTLVSASASGLCCNVNGRSVWGLFIRISTSQVIQCWEGEGRVATCRKSSASVGKSR